ncbi:MAG: hypothetical protein WHS38_10650 [Thermodesulforhabdaceae bacterium]
MPVSVSFIKELDTVDPKLRRVLITMLEELERQREESVTKKEFIDLKEIVRELGKTVQDLAVAQKRTEERVNELAEAQKRTEQRLESLATRVEELAEAQKRTEERLESLAKRVDELAEAQKRTEERLESLAKRVDELAEAQKRTEQRLNELAEAQRKTEIEVAKLASSVDVLRHQVGGLSRSMAFALENEAYRKLPEFLKVNYGIEVTDRLIRTHIGDSEINVFGKAIREGKEVYLVGDAVLKLDDISKISQVWDQVESVKQEFGGEVVPIIITHFAKPNVMERARQAGIIVVQSFEW